MPGSRFGLGISSSGRRSRVISLVGVAVTIACISLLLLWVPFGDVWRAMTAAHPVWLAIAMAPVAVNILLRGLRLVLLLGHPGHVPVIPATAISAAGLGINATMPGKVGELARIGLAVRVLGVRPGVATMATIIERGIDLGVLACGGFVCLGVLGLFGQDTAYDNARFGSLVATMALLSLLFLVFILIVANDSLGKKLHRWLKRAIPGSAWPRRLRRLGLDVSTGAKRFLRPRTAVSTVLVTITMWFMLGLSVYAVGLAMPGVRCSLLVASIFAIITTLASALPSVPGAWGVYETVGIAVASVLVPHDSVSALAAFVIATHALQYLPVVVMGLAGWQWLSFGANS